MVCLKPSISFKALRLQKGQAGEMPWDASTSNSTASWIYFWFYCIFKITKLRYFFCVSSARCPCPWWGGWKETIFKVSSRPNHSIIICEDWLISSNHSIILCPFGPVQLSPKDWHDQHFLSREVRTVQRCHLHRHWDLMGNLQTWDSISEV